jgi:glycolate oxidase iron-sulfur subunit
LHAHAGQHEQALALARRNVTAFSRQQQEVPVVVNAAGCGAMLKEYGRLLSDDPMHAEAAAFSARVRDVSEVTAAGSLCRGAPLDLTVAYDPPCHLLHAQRIAREPLATIDAIPGLTRVVHRDAEVCCGSAGSFTFSQPGISNAVLAEKIERIQAVNPDVVATGNPGCIMQIGAGLRAAGDRTPVVHPIELLDWSYAKAGLYDE